MRFSIHYLVSLTTLKFSTDPRYSAAWLAKQLYCDRTNVYKIFHKASIDCELLLKISIVLNYDFFKIYSKLVANSHSGNEQ